MPRFKLTIEYAGTRYSGWQIQKNARTVAGELERAIARGDRRRRRSSSTARAAPTRACTRWRRWRTCRSTRGSTPATLLWRINDELPADINVLDLERAPQRFHARHDAVARSYLYQIARRRTAFAKPFVWWVREDLDVEAMREAAAAFVGLKDFRSFTPTTARTTSTKVQVDARRDPRGAAAAPRSASSARTSCGGWSGGWSACWWPSGGAS